MAATPGREIAAAARLSALDRWTLGYAVLAVIVIGLRWRGPFTALLTVLAAHAALAACAQVAGRARAKGGLARFLGEFYPMLALVMLYGSIGVVNTHAGVAHDRRVQLWEQALFGGQPSRDWIRAWPFPWLSGLLHAGYLSYYVILATAPLGLWASGRRDQARRTALAVMVTFYACYAVFLVFPVAGPRYTFAPAHNAATAALAAVLTQRLLERAAAWGTAFPSSHVAASLVASVSAWRGLKPLGAPLVVLAVLLTLGTVYGQFHYAVDALAGAALAAAVLILDPRPERGHRVV